MRCFSSLEIKGHVVGCDSPEVAMSYNDIGGVYKSRGDYDNALLRYQKRLKIKLRAYGQGHLLVDESYNNIGIVYQRQGKQEEASEQFQKSLEIRIRVYGQDHPLVADTKYGMCESMKCTTRWIWRASSFSSANGYASRCMNLATGGR